MGEGLLRLLAQSRREWPRILVALLMAAIPAIGVLVFDWNLTTVLILVWIESLLYIPAMRWRTSAYLRSVRGIPVPGEAAPAPLGPHPATLAKRLQGISIVFCVLLGVITLEAPIRALLLGVGGPAWRIDPAALAWGIGWIALGLALEGFLEHRRRAGGPPDWIHTLLDARFSGLAVLALLLMTVYTAIPGPERTRFLVDHPHLALAVVLGVKFLIDIAPVIFPPHVPKQPRAPTPAS
jgi:ABC-type amino acid transport system permease subunit